MEIDAVLGYFDTAATNLERAENIWNRAKPLIEHLGADHANLDEYRQLRRVWRDMLTGLPPIGGWVVSADLPDPEDTVREFSAAREVGVWPSRAVAEVEAPGMELAEYRYRLARARRRAVREHLAGRLEDFEALANAIASGVPADSRESVSGGQVDEAHRILGEIERLLGDSVAKLGRWFDLRRHMRFSQGHDWRDVVELDWPTVKADIEAASLSDEDPLPIPSLDLAEVAGGEVTGTINMALMWDRLEADSFERLLYEIFRQLDGYENVQWLMKTNAPDRGRDLSVERTLHDGAGSVRRERVMVQAKHWLSRSVAQGEILGAVGSATTAHPGFQAVIVATSGRFTSDAVSFAEVHNDRGDRPRIDLWPDSQLESILARMPAVVAAFGLR